MNDFLAGSSSKIQLAFRPQVLGQPLGQQLRLPWARRQQQVHYFQPEVRPQMKSRESVKLVSF